MISPTSRIIPVLATVSEEENKRPSTAWRRPDRFRIYKEFYKADANDCACCRSFLYFAQPAALVGPNSLQRLFTFLSLTEQFHLTHSYVGCKTHKNLGNQNICLSKNNIYIIFGHCLKVTHGKMELCRTDQPDKTVQSNTTQQHIVSCEHIANHYVEQTFANRPTFHWPVKHNQRCLCYWGNITVWQS